MQNSMIKLNSGQLRKAMKSAFAGFVVTVVFVAVSSLLIWKEALPEGVTKELSIACMTVGAMASGRLAAGKGRGLLKGISGGIGYMIIAIAVGLYRQQTDYFDLDFLRFLICVMAGSAFGGIISTGKRNKKQHFRRK